MSAPGKVSLQTRGVADHVDIISGRARRRLETAVAAVAGLIPLIVMVSANALAPLIIILAIGVVLWGPRRELFRYGPRQVAVALALLATLGLASTAWSIVPKLSVHKFFQLLPLFAAACIVVAAARQLPTLLRDRAGRWLAIGIVVAALLVAAEAALGGPLNHLLTTAILHENEIMLRYKRGATVLALLAGPAAYWALSKGSFVWLAMILGAVLSTAILVGSGTAGVAIVVGCLGVLLTRRLPSVSRIGLAAFLVVLVLGAPLVRFAPNEVPATAIHEIQSGGLYRVNSAVHRLLIWQFVGERIAERPMLGWGLDSSRAVPGGQDNVQGYSERLPLHPHNAALQLWLELGFFGSILGAFIVAWIVLGVEDRIAAGLAQAVAVGVVAAAAAVAFLGFGIWQSWWVGTLGLVSMCTVAVLPPRTEPT